MKRVSFLRSGELSMADQEEMHPAGNDQGGVSATPVQPRKRESPQKSPPRPLPPWKVILHNDDVNDIVKVVRIVRQLTHLSKEEAITRTLEADKTGAALLLVTHQERAELYIEQFSTYTLTVTAEPEA